jgi:circadian clock protein KaiC
MSASHGSHTRSGKAAVPVHRSKPSNAGQAIGNKGILESSRKHLEKCATGIPGLDEITQGGLPRGRPTLIAGAARCGKTLLAMEFIVRGILQFNEPGVFVTFEESEEDLAKNVASLGFDVEDLVSRKKLVVDYVHIEPTEIVETGEYDLEGLFVRLDAAFRSVGAKRVALDTVESLFGGISNAALCRRHETQVLRGDSHCDRNLRRKSQEPI